MAQLVNSCFGLEILWIQGTTNMIAFIRGSIGNYHLKPPVDGCHSRSAPGLRPPTNTSRPEQAQHPNELWHWHQANRATTTSPRTQWFYKTHSISARNNLLHFTSEKEEWILCHYPPITSKLHKTWALGAPCLRKKISWFCWCRYHICEYTGYTVYGIPNFLHFWLVKYPSLLLKKISRYNPSKSILRLKPHLAHWSRHKLGGYPPAN